MSAGRPIRFSARFSACPGRLPVKTSGATPHQAPHEGMSLAVTSQADAVGYAPGRPPISAGAGADGRPGTHGLTGVSTPAETTGFSETPEAPLHPLSPAP